MDDGFWAGVVLGVAAAIVSIVVLAATSHDAAHNSCVGVTGADYCELRWVPVPELSR